jgi:hypothetical protein
MFRKRGKIYLASFEKKEEGGEVLILTYTPL